MLATARRRYREHRTLIICYLCELLLPVTVALVCLWLGGHA